MTETWGRGEHEGIKEKTRQQQTTSLVESPWRSNERKREHRNSGSGWVTKSKLLSTESSTVAV